MTQMDYSAESIIIEVTSLRYTIKFPSIKIKSKMHVIYFLLLYELYFTQGFNSI